LKKINIIGAGNVAHYYAWSLHEAGADIRCIYNRSIEKANALAGRCGSMATDDLIALPEADLTIIAISDDHIAQMAQNIVDIHGPEVTMIHCSGSLGIEIFPKEARNVGIAWPVQSISKEQTYNKSDVPICLEASHPTLLKVLLPLFQMISDEVHYLSSNQKKHAHVAAVIANNFSNHLYALAEEHCIENGVNFNILKPLIIQSANKIATTSPKNLQTGPAKRNDTQTINQHLDLISKGSLKKVYKRISKSITKMYHENSKGA